jgi:osmotically-inducible protein OsmY
MKNLVGVLSVTVLILGVFACSPSQQARVKATANDAFLAAQVKAKIAGVDPATLSLVTVDVENKKVTLTGEVHSVAEREKVDQAVRTVPGIAGLNDRLRVNPKAPTANEIAADLELQTRVQAAIAGQTGVNALKITVSAHHGIVTLTGTVPSATVRTLAVQTAQGVQGVRQVVDRLHVQR